MVFQLPRVSIRISDQFTHEEIHPRGTLVSFVMALYTIVLIILFPFGLSLRNMLCICGSFSANFSFRFDIALYILLNIILIPMYVFICVFYIILLVVYRQESDVYM